MGMTQIGKLPITKFMFRASKNVLLFLEAPKKRKSSKNIKHFAILQNNF